MRYYYVTGVGKYFTGKLIGLLITGIAFNAAMVVIFVGSVYEKLESILTKIFKL